MGHRQLATTGVGYAHDTNVVGDKQPVPPMDPRRADWHIDEKPLAPVLEAVCINPKDVVNLPKSYRKDRVYIVPGGIGDIAWIYAKLLSTKKPIIFAVAANTTNILYSAIAVRAFPFLDLLENVKYSTVALCTSEQVYWASIAMDFSNGVMPSTPAYMACNRWLEKGLNLDTFMPKLKTVRHFPMKRPQWAKDEADLFLKEGEEAFAIYPSSKDYFGDQNVAMLGWIKIVKELARRNPKAKIMLMGAPWDLSMLTPLYDSLCAVGFADRLVLMHDRNFATSLEILRRCKFLIGAVSGLTIVAEYQYVPTVHLYPRQLTEVDKLLGTWECPDMVAQGTSLSLPVIDGAEKNLRRILKEFAPVARPVPVVKKKKAVMA